MQRRWRGIAALGCAAVLAACGQGGDGKGGADAKAKAADAKAPPPQSARARVMAMDPTAAADFLIDQVRNGPGGPRECAFAYEFADLGDVPAGEAAGPHRGHAGARAFTLQCGAPGDRGARRYVVYLPRTRPEPVVAACAAAACAEGFLRAGDAAPVVPAEDFEK